MTDRELLQQALDALNALTKELLACRDELAERGARPETPHKQKLWDSAFNAYIGMAIPTYESIRARLAQPDSATHSADSAESFCKPEPVAWGILNTRPTEKQPLMMVMLDEPEPSHLVVPLYTAPPQHESTCAECDKKQSDGWALYCVDCLREFYKHDPTNKREWVGLTAADLMELVAFTHMTMENALSVEAKLKDKNI